MNNTIVLHECKLCGQTFDINKMFYTLELTGKPGEVCREDFKRLLKVYA